MLGIKFYGVHKATIGMGEFMVYCPSCEADNFADFMATSNYYHFYFVPVFPFEKEANIVCQKCGLKRYEVPFKSKVVQNIFEVNSKFKHPWYTYAFLLVIAFIILLIAIFAK